MKYQHLKKSISTQCFSRITEKDIGPYIGKTELETLDDLTSAEDEAAPITLPTAIQEITPGTNEENTAAKDKECTVSTEIESDAETDNEDKVVTDNENTAVADKDEPSLKGSIEECSTLSLWWVLGYSFIIRGYFIFVF